MNPLLHFNLPTDFSSIKPEHFEPAIDFVIADNKKMLASLLALSEKTWENFVEPLEEMEDKLSQVWAIISHLEAVQSFSEIRTAYKICLEKVTDYSTALGQNEALYQGYQAVHDSEGFHALTAPQQKLIADTLRDFKLSGVSLSADKKKEYTALSQTLSKLSNVFSDHVLDATQAWFLHVEEAEKLKSLPLDVTEAAKKLAEEKGKPGFLFSLDYAPYHAILTYCDDRELRKAMYSAFVTRASDQGPNGGQFDNTQIMKEIVVGREKLAHLLDFENYASLSLATKMAKNTDEVIEFLKNLAEKAKNSAIEEKETLFKFAEKKGIAGTLQAWDLAYYSEKLKQETYGFNEQETRAYFELNQVISGLFEITGKLFGIQVKEQTGKSVPHADVRLFEIYENNHKKGEVYADFFARPLKTDGAWMHDARSRKHLKLSALQLPIAYLNTNFQKPVEGSACLLTHREVETVFHEFGHCLQHILTNVDYPSIAGIQGIEWDAVELPSQFLENWCWHEASLSLFAKHHETKMSIPSTLLQKMKAAKNFQSAGSVLRQVEFALFDFYAHSLPTASLDLNALMQKIRQEVAVYSVPTFNRFTHSFSHIFSGGYAAGYYSYQWAEVLSCDLFSLFEERGIFDAAAGKAFKDGILAPGASRDAMAAFIEVRGRPPSLEPFLRQMGLGI